MKYLTIAAVLVIVLIVGLCIVISVQPNFFLITRSELIDAPHAKVFAQVNDLAAWDAWTPWKKLDPNPKTKLSIPSHGKGATFEWSGNDEIGEGILTIVESDPAGLIEIDQEFFKPFAGKARITFEVMIEVPHRTLVTWTMTGENDFMGKAMCLFMNMEVMLGPKLEEGLANLKEVAEKSDPERAE